MNNCNDPTIHGIVLAGGQSSRMGTDKALLPVNGSPLIRHICDELSHFVNEITVVLPFAASNRYSGILAASTRTVQDVYSNQGPLAGIHAGLSGMPQEVDYVFLMACDMPLFSPALFNVMKAALNESPNPDVVLCSGQPFHAIYHRRAAAIAEQLLRRNQRKLNVFIHALQYVYIEQHNESCFLNLNTISDYHAFLNMTR